MSLENTTDSAAPFAPVPESVPETVEIQTPEFQQEEPRGAIAEWTITILLLVFLTTTLVQAFVIPTGSMEDTLLIGDHLLVDKLAFAPYGPVSKYLLPYTDVKRGDIIVFRYPVDITQTFVKRCIGVPGDRIKIIAGRGFSWKTTRTSARATNGQRRFARSRKGRAESATFPCSSCPPWPSPTSRPGIASTGRMS